MDKLINALKEINLPVYIAGHINPDDDSVASCLSLAYLLNNLGKTTYVLLEDKDRNILDNHSLNVNISNSVSDKEYVFIMLDSNETYRLGNFEQYYINAKLKICMDHHQGNYTNADIVLSQSNVSSTCEIIYNLISNIDEELLSDLNLCQSLYIGILTDSKCFSKRLSNATMYIAQTLINKGLDYEKIIRRTYNYRTFYQYKALSKLIEDIRQEKYFYYAIIDKEVEVYSKLSHNDIVKVLSEEIRKIDGVDILIVLIKYPDKITGKVVSNISKNAHLIAACLGGGGHSGEAGFITNKSTEEIFSIVNDYINKNTTN